MDNIINKIMGNKSKKSFSCDNAFNKPINGKGLGAGLGMGLGNGAINKQGIGQGLGMANGMGSMNMNLNRQFTRPTAARQFLHSPYNDSSREIMDQVKNVLDAMPEVKGASGKIQISFKNGKTAILHLSYNE